MTAPNLEQPDDADIDASLTLDGFDASDRYPEYGHSALRAAYRSGWADVVAAIRDSGYTVIALPEANSRGRWASSHSFSDPGYLDWSVGVNGSVPFARARRGKGPESSAARDHADFGAALIAAAQHATGDTQ